MTTTQLRAILAAMLAEHLGTYSTPNGSRPALYVGDPPSDWTPHGLEVRIAVIPDMRQVPAYARGALDETHQVRLVSHGAPASAYAALRAVLSRWPDAQAVEVPANEQLGILSQHTISIPA